MVITQSICVPNNRLNDVIFKNHVDAMNSIIAWYDKCTEVCNFYSLFKWRLFWKKCLKFFRNISDVLMSYWPKYFRFSSIEIELIDLDLLTYLIYLVLINFLFLFAIIYYNWILILHEKRMTCVSFVKKVIKVITMYYLKCQRVSVQPYFSLLLSFFDLFILRWGNIYIENQVHNQHGWMTD